MITIIQNKKAYFNYNILDKYIAGVQLMGTEVKSIRNSNASINEAYCGFIDGEIYIMQMHISDYKEIKYTNHQPIRDRKLLLNKKEIKKLKIATKEKGLTIIPLAVKLSSKGYIKIEIGLAKGKKTYQKRESIKEKDIKKEYKNN